MPRLPLEIPQPLNQHLLQICLHKQLARFLTTTVKLHLVRCVVFIWRILGKCFVVFLQIIRTWFYRKSLILASESGLVVGKYTKSPEIIHLNQTPYKVIYQEQTNTIVVITEQLDMILGTIHNLTLLDADNYLKVFSTPLPAGEKYVE